MNGLTPDYLLYCVPPLVQDTTIYNLRNSNDIQSLHANTNLFYNSFFPSTIRAWNSLPEDIKQATSVSSFKYRLNRYIKKPSKYYNAGTRVGQILQGRIRMECSSLNFHLYRKNIVLTPTCQCGGFESPCHFSFQCLRYAAARNRFLPHDNNRYNSNDFLFGIEGKSVITRHCL